MLHRPALLLAFVGMTASACGTSPQSGGPSICDPYFESDAMRALVEALDAVAAVDPVWDDYTVASHPLVLSGTPPDSLTAGNPEAPHGCAGIWRADHPLQRLELVTPIGLPIPLYGYWVGLPPGPDAEPQWRRMAESMQETALEVERALRADGEDRALILPTPLDYDEMGDVGVVLRELAPLPVVLQTLLAIHESYHLHAQLPALFDQEAAYPWPEWDRQPDRNLLASWCFQGSVEVARAHESELDHLLAAWDRLWPPDGSEPDLTAALTEARAFVDGRIGRHRPLAQIRVPGEGLPIPCAIAEDVMELEEGSASWIATRTAVRAGVMSLEEVRGTYTDPMNPAYYQSGSFQMWVMEGLFGAEVAREEAARIVRSVAPESADGAIFGRFRSLVSEGATRVP